MAASKVPEPVVQRARQHIIDSLASWRQINELPGIVPTGSVLKYLTCEADSIHADATHHATLLVCDALSAAHDDWELSPHPHVAERIATVNSGPHTAGPISTH